MKSLLPIDVVEEIMSKLPVKHLLRCKLLCKSYYNLIKSPSFITRHHQSPSRSTNIMVRVHLPGVYNGVVVRKPPIDFILPLSSPPADAEEEESQLYVPPSRAEKRLSSFDVVGSCNGLLCAKEYHDGTYTVWNPATREYIHLPPRPHDDSSMFYVPFLGFGHDAGSNDYKVVQISECRGREKGNQWSAFKVESWSMNSNTWSQIGFIPTDLISAEDYRFHPSNGMFLRGRLYTLAVPRMQILPVTTRLEYRVGRVLDPFLVCFDLSDNITCRKIALPPDVVKDFNKRAPITRTDIIANLMRPSALTLRDFMGSLSLFVRLSSSSATSDQTFFDVWVMGVDENRSKNWTRRFSIGPFFQQHVEPTSVYVNGAFLMKIRNWPSDGDSFEFIYYDPFGNKEVKREILPLSAGGDRRSLVPWCFTESAVPIEKAKERPGRFSDEESVGGWMNWRLGPARAVTNKKKKCLGNTPSI